MINLKEIRNGNWLSTYDGNWGIVKSIKERIMLDTFAGVRGYLPEELFPINVTTDILSVCGFQQLDGRFRHKDSYILLRYYADGDLGFETANDVLPFAFVHQLQNIYLNATGQFLEPNLYGN